MTRRDFASAREIPTEVWRWSSRDGLYFLDGLGEGLTFDEIAERSDHVAGHDDAPRVRIEFGPPLDEPDAPETGPDQSEIDPDWSEIEPDQPEMSPE